MASQNLAKCVRVKEKKIKKGTVAGQKCKKSAFPDTCFLADANTPKRRLQSNTERVSP